MKEVIDKKWKPDVKRAWQAFYAHAEAEELIPKEEVVSQAEEEVVPEEEVVVLPEEEVASVEEWVPEEEVASVEEVEEVSQAEEWVPEEEEVLQIEEEGFEEGVVVSQTDVEEVVTSFEGVVGLPEEEVLQIEEEVFEEEVVVPAEVEVVSQTEVEVVSEAVGVVLQTDVEVVPEAEGVVLPEEEVVLQIEEEVSQAEAEVVVSQMEVEVEIPAEEKVVVSQTEEEVVSEEMEEVLQIEEEVSQAEAEVVVSQMEVEVEIPAEEKVAVSQTAAEEYGGERSAGGVGKRGAFVVWCVVALFCVLCIGLIVLFFVRSSRFSNRSEPPFVLPVDLFEGQPAAEEVICLQSIGDDEVLGATLPDGSVALLAEGCSLTYPSSFASDWRGVVLEGEAFFEVAEEQSRPFIIETELIVVETIGASFRIKTDSDFLFELAVRSGVVKIAFYDDEQELFAGEGEQVLFVDNLLKKSDIEDDESLSLRGSKLCFKGELLGQIIRVVNECAPGSMQLLLGDESLFDQVITITLRLENMEQMAITLCNELGLTQTIEEEGIYLWPK